MSDPQPPGTSQNVYVQALAQDGQGMAIASLVLGILSILFVWIPIVGMISWVLAPLGLIFGFLVVGKPAARGLAIGGIVTSGIGLLGCIGWVLLFGAAMASGVAAS